MRFCVLLVLVVVLVLDLWPRFEDEEENDDEDDPVASPTFDRARRPMQRQNFLVFKSQNPDYPED